MNGNNWKICECNNNLRRRRQMAEDESAFAAFEYTRQRPYLETGSEKVLELARLDYFYRVGYQSLNGVFSEAEMASLVASFKGEIFTPQRIQGIDSVFICNSIFSGAWLNPGEELIYEKLRCLSQEQRLTLADTLEQLCYRAPDAGGQVELLAELGIILRQ